MLVCLHGFLGSSKDFSFIKDEKFAPDFFIKGTKFPPSDLESWAKNIASEIKEPSVLLGYSLGARIGLYLLDLFPKLFTDAILIAPYLGGLENPKERLLSDRKWAERFLKEPFDKVTADWDNQPIFKNSKKPKREALDVRLLSDSLTLASPALQKDFRNAEFLSQVHLLAGEHDQKFIDHLRHYPNFIIVPGAGHRVLHDRPDLIGELVGKAA